MSKHSMMSQIGVLIRETGQSIDRLGCRIMGNHAFKEQLSRHRAVMNYGEKIPLVPSSAFVAPSASVIGDVKLGAKSSIWYGCVVRGDVNSIKIGEKTNIQDGCIIHVAKTNAKGVELPTIIGSRVTVGHAATLHACNIADEAFVGMGATVMDGAKVETGAMVAAGALVPAGTVIPTGQIWAGSPAKFLRNLTAEETAFITTSADNYAALAETHLAENFKSFEVIEADKKVRKANKERSEDYDSHLGLDPTANAVQPTM